MRTSRKTGQRRRSPSGRWMSVSTLPGLSAPTDPGTLRSSARKSGRSRQSRSHRAASEGRWGRKRPVNRKRSPTGEQTAVRVGLVRRLTERLVGAAGRNGSRKGSGARRFGWIKGLGFVAALAAVAVGGWAAYRFVTRSSYFAVRKVTFSPTEHVTEAELRGLAALSATDNIFSVDLEAVAARVASHPWVASAKAERRLPGEVHIEIIEQQAVAALSLGGFYLVNRKGRVFKKATLDEVRALPVITGIGRDAYRRKSASSLQAVQTALSAIDAYAARRGRPLLGEVHVDDRGAVTLYSRKKGIQIRLGRAAFHTKLSRFDAVWAALGKRRDLLRVVRLDNAVRPERVTVRLADDAELSLDQDGQPSGPEGSAKGDKVVAEAGSHKNGKAGKGRRRKARPVQGRAVARQGAMRKTARSPKGPGRSKSLPSAGQVADRSVISN